jgi:hypothetical protein
MKCLCNEPERAASEGTCRPALKKSAFRGIDGWTRDSCLGAERTLDATRSIGEWTRNCVPGAGRTAALHPSDEYKAEVRTSIVCCDGKLCRVRSIPAPKARNELCMRSQCAIAVLYCTAHCVTAPRLRGHNSMLPNAVTIAVAGHDAT